MPIRERVVAFAPLVVLTLLASLGAALGLRSSESGAVGWAYVVQDLIDAPGVRFTFESSSCSPDVEPRCAGSQSVVRESGVVRLEGRRSHAVRTFDTDQPLGEKSRDIAFRTDGDEEYVKLSGCWVVSPEGSTTANVVPVLAAGPYPGAEPDAPAGWVAAPAPAVMSLLGYPEPLWDHSGFPTALQSYLPSAELPVRWAFEGGELSLTLEGREVASELAHHGYRDELVQVRLRNVVATWRGTALDEAPEIPAPEPAC